MQGQRFGEMVGAYTAAWNSKLPEAVAEFFSDDVVVIINCGEPWSGQSGVAEMAAGFFADVPDLLLTSDDARRSGTHAINVWTFSGHDAVTGNPVRVSGWEEWEFDATGKVCKSYGWFDAEDYARQVAGG